MSKKCQSVGMHLTPVKIKAMHWNPIYVASIGNTNADTLIEQDQVLFDLTKAVVRVQDTRWKVILRYKYDGQHTYM
jgi:hypothetical protein